VMLFMDAKLTLKVTFRKIHYLSIASLLDALFVGRDDHFADNSTGMSLNIVIENASSPPSPEYHGTRI